jgi:thiamine-monophosphate kinase
MSETPADLASLGEFGLIDRFAARTVEGELTAVGIGDDTAVVDVGGTSLLLTTDLMVEGVHFLAAAGGGSPSGADLADVGYKALIANVSDVAAMGGRPRECVVSLAAPPETEVAALDRLWSGIGEAAGEYGVTIVGGDTTAAPVLFVNVALLGEAPGGDWVGRDGAHVGDEVLVTGTLGDSAGGLAVLLGGEQPAIPAEERLVSAHLRPRARVEEGAIALDAGASAMIDVSDGLLADLGHLCERSGVGIAVEAASVPVSEDLTEAADALEVDPLELALAGGEDYELAIAVPAALAAELVERIGWLDTRCTRIGAVVEGDGVSVSGRDAGGPTGWDHFGGNGRR